MLSGEKSLSTVTQQSIFPVLKKIYQKIHVKFGTRDRLRKKKLPSYRVAGASWGLKGRGVVVAGASRVAFSGGRLERVGLAKANCAQQRL